MARSLGEIADPQPSDDPERNRQLKLMAAVVSKTIPPAARVALGLAGVLYEQGMRIHPELAQKEADPTPSQEAWTPEAQEDVMERAFATLRDMAEQFPYLRPLVEKIEKAQTPQERAALAMELRKQIPDEMIAQAQAEVEKIDDTE